MARHSSSSAVRQDDFGDQERYLNDFLTCVDITVALFNPPKAKADKFRHYFVEKISKCQMECHPLSIFIYLNSLSHSIGIRSASYIICSCLANRVGEKIGKKSNQRDDDCGKDREKEKTGNVRQRFGDVRHVAEVDSRGIDDEEQSASGDQDHVPRRVQVSFS